MSIMGDIKNSFVSIAKGMRLTLIYWSPAKKPVTQFYPEVMPKLPERFRGMPTLVFDEEKGDAKCIACGMCARTCPVGIIKVVADTTDPKNRKPKTFEINVSRCMFCGMCVDVCPAHALASAKTFELVTETREDMIYDKEKLIDMGRVTCDVSKTLRKVK